MQFLIDNEQSHTKVLRQLNSALYEIEHWLVGPAAETASTGPSEVPSDHFIARMVDAQSETREEIERAERVVQRIREKMGLIEASPKIAPSKGNY